MPFFLSGWAPPLLPATRRRNCTATGNARSSGQPGTLVLFDSAVSMGNAMVCAARGSRQGNPQMERACHGNFGTTSDRGPLSHNQPPTQAIFPVLCIALVEGNRNSGTAVL